MSNRVLHSSAVLLILAVFAANQALAASIGDKTILLANGTTKVKVVYSVVGVYDDTQLATVFTCTNTEKDGGNSAVIAIEVIDQSGNVENDITLGDGVVTVTAGRTGLWETSNVAAMVSANDAIDFVTTFVNGGSARILSDSSKIICSAAVVEVAGDPPTSMMSIPVFRKLKQGGD